MNLDHLSRERKIIVMILLLLPLLISVFLIVYLKFFVWSIDLAGGDSFSPIENRPLFVGLILFTLGYLFFLGIMFSHNILEIFDKRVMIK